MKFVSTNSTDPYFNLACEEYLLKNYDGEFFMLWQNAPTVVVGRNQNTLSEVNVPYANENGITVVRRMSGGGAVYHDAGNLNYTFIVNSDKFCDFAYFTKPITDALAGFGIHAELSGRNDIILNGRKISGAAQYAYKNRLLHHGTLMFYVDIEKLSNVLSVDGRKIESKGISSVQSRVTNIDGVSIEDFVENTKHRYDEFKLENINEIEKLAGEKYGTWEWNFGYSPKYSFTKSARTNGGTVEVNIDVSDGYIRDIKIFGDFFSKRDVTEFTALFIGKKHNIDEIKDVIEKMDITDYFLGIDKNELVSLFY